MIKFRLLVCISLSVCATLSYAADSCYDLYTLDEGKFTTRVQNSPDIYNQLNQCITNQACSTSDNQALCMQNLYYYDAMAAYYYQHALSNPSRMMAKTPSNTIAPAPTPAAAPQNTNNYSQPVIIAPSNTPNSNSNENDIYKNIQF